jgi:hypothetical protein
MSQATISKGFIWSLTRTVLVGFALLSALVAFGEAMSFGDGAYFLGVLVVVVVTTLTDRADSYTYRRRSLTSRDQLR